MEYHCVSQGNDIAWDRHGLRKAGESVISKTHIYLSVNFETLKLKVFSDTKHFICKFLFKETPEIWIEGPVLVNVKQSRWHSADVLNSTPTVILLNGNT